MLVAAGLVGAAQVDEALAAQKGTGKRLGEMLVSLGHVSEQQMTQVLSNQLSIPWVNLYHVDFSRELLERVPAPVAEEYSLVPVYVRHVRKQGDTLYVAMDDPLNVDALQVVADCCGLPVKPMVASPTDITNAIRVYYLGLPALEEEDEDFPEVSVEEEEELASEPPSEPEAEEPVEAGASPAAERAESPAQERPAARGAAEATAVEAREEEEDEDEGPSAKPSPAPAPRRGPGPGFLTLTLLDGTTVRLPSKPTAATTDEGKAQPERGLTTRDLIHALTARAAGKDVSGVLPEDAWEPLLAALLSVLLRKGLVADWEFVAEWNKQRKRIEKRKK
jgi:type IV pilus assembly protein PilB